MMRTLADALGVGDKTKDVLDQFIHLAMEDPKFFRWQLRDVEAREKAPGMMRKLPLFTHTCFAMLLNLLLDIKDETSWHSADDDFDEAGATDNHIFGRQCLKRFSFALGRKAIVPVAMEQLGDYLVAPEWEKRHAALVALVQIAEGSSKVMTKYLQQVVDMVLRSFQDPHPRVKWAAIRAIGRFSVDFGPVFQEQYHKRVWPALAEAMDDSKNPLGQARATSSVPLFCSSEPETLVPYLDKILNKLLVLLQNDSQMVHEAALRAFSFTNALSKAL